MLADLDDLLTALFVLVDDFLPARRGAGRRPGSLRAELITLAVAQVLLQCHSERRFLRLARKQLGHLFPYIPLQPGYNKRLRALAGRSAWSSSISPGSRRRSASSSACWIPRRCRAASRGRRASARSWPAGPPTATAPRIPGTSGACGSTCSAPRTGCRSASASPQPTSPNARSRAMLERARERGLLSGGEIIIGDKGFASHEFERAVASLAATFIRPDRRDEKPPVREARRDPPMDRVDQRHPQRPTLPGESRRSHPHRSLGPCLPTHPRTRRRRLEQLATRTTRPQLHRLRPLKRNQPSRVPRLADPDDGAASTLETEPEDRVGPASPGARDVLALVLVMDDEQGDGPCSA